MMDVYGDSISGNCLKVRYTADYLGISYSWHELDLMQGETRTDDFLAMNAAGQVPVIKLDDGRTLAQSNAIIEYLATDSPLLPTDSFQRALVHQWMYWEQYSHEPYVAVLRFAMKYQGRGIDERDAWRVERGESALDLMENALSSRSWLVGDALTIADISLLAYTRLAHEGGFDLSHRDAIRRWITRCEVELDIES